jgi:hypothetical protein
VQISHFEVANTSFVLKFSHTNFASDDHLNSRDLVCKNFFFKHARNFNLLDTRVVHF